MTDISEEQRRAENIRQYEIRRMPLKEALAYATKPVYGLTEEVFGLQHEAHSWRNMSIGYRSPLYAQYAFRNDRTFVVETRIFEEEQNVAFGFFRSVIEAGNVIFAVCPVPDSVEFVNLFAAREKSLRIVTKDAALSIDGKPFKGDIMHYTDPVRYSSFTFYHERIGLQGEALGPSIEEVAEIIKSLRVLNAEQIVERNKMQ